MYITPFAIQPTEILAGCIAVYEDVWENYEETIKTLEEVTSTDPNVNFAKAILSDGSVSTGRTNQHLSLTEAGYVNEEMRKLNNRFVDLTYSALRDYSSRFSIQEQINFNEGINVLKYQTGEEYKAHYDGGSGSGRAVSPILYLNDEYTGGEIEFVNFNVKIKPKAGTFLLFPSTYAYAHIAHPVKTGTKYAFVTWLHDRSI